MYKIKYCLMSFLLYFFIEISAIKNYGQYEMLITSAKSCKGPKRKDCANFTVALKGQTTVSFNCILGEDIASIKGKVTGSLDKKDIFKTDVAKPCDHIFFMAVFKALWKATDECVIFKGRYKFDVNVVDMMSKYYGAAFMFGNWTYKVLFYNDHCNFICSIYEVVISSKRTV